EADLALFRFCFPKNASLALLIKPPKTGLGTAMFFLGEDGRLAAQRATVEFPFNLAELGGTEPAPAADRITLAKAPARRPSLWKMALLWTAVIGSAAGLYRSRTIERK